MDWKTLWQDLWSNHRGVTIGIFVGVGFGLLTVIFSIWKAFFVLLCLAVGFFWGKSVDEKRGIKEVFKDSYDQVFKK